MPRKRPRSLGSATAPSFAIERNFAFKSPLPDPPGRPTTGFHDDRRKGGASCPLVVKDPGRWRPHCSTDPCGPCGKVGLSCSPVNDLSTPGASRMEKGGSRHQDIPRATRRIRTIIKKLSERLYSSHNANKERRPFRLMFQDEARFGRITDPRSCWAPAPPSTRDQSGPDSQIRVRVCGGESPGWGSGIHECRNNRHGKHEPIPSSSASRPSGELHRHGSRLGLFPQEQGAEGSGPHEPDSSASLLSGTQSSREALEHPAPGQFRGSSLFQEKTVEEAEKGLSVLPSNRDALSSLTYWPRIHASLNAN